MRAPCYRLFALFSQRIIENSLNVGKHVSFRVANLFVSGHLVFSVPSEHYLYRLLSGKLELAGSFHFSEHAVNVSGSDPVSARAV